MKLGHIEIFVRDSQRAREFYTALPGFEVVAEQPGGFVWLRSGAQEILLRPGRKSPPPADYSHGAIALVFYTDNLQQTAGELRARGAVFGEPDGAECCLTFRDPDGNWHQLVNPDHHEG